MHERTAPVDAVEGSATLPGLGQTVSSHGNRLSPHLRILLFAAAAICLILSAYAAYHRSPWSDEGWFSSASYNLAKRGFMGTTVMETAGTSFTRDQRTYWVMPLFLLGQAAWYLVFPTDLFWTRAFTILWIPFTLAAYYLFLRKLLGAAAAALACILLSLTYHFIDNGSFGRPDLMCMGLGLAGLAVYVLRREQSFASAFFLANLCMALSIFTHPNGVFHIGALGVLFLVHGDWRRLTLAALAAGALPYVVIGGAWGLYAMQDPEAFRNQLTANGTNGRWTGTWNPVAIVANEIRERYFPAYGFVTRGSAVLKASALVAYLVGIACVLGTRELRHRPEVRLMCLLVLAYFCMMSVFNQKLSYYLIHIIPFYVAVLAVWLHWLWSRFPRMRLAVAGAVLALIAVECAGIVLRGMQRSYIPALRPAADFVKNRTGPNDRIVATGALVYEFGFSDRLRDDMYLGLRSGRLPDVIIMENLYGITYSYWKDERPEDMRHILDRLATYELVYDHAGYKVYMRPGTARS